MKFLDNLFHHKHDSQASFSIISGYDDVKNIINRVLSSEENFNLLLVGTPASSKTTETNAQVTVNSAFTFSQVLANVISNSISSASTLTLRANGGDAGSVAVSIGANSTGVFVDATDTYTAATTDAMSYKLTTGTTGTSISISHLSVWGNISAQVATGRKYQHFDLRPNRILSQQHNPFGSSNQMVIFG